MNILQHPTIQFIRVQIARYWRSTLIGSIFLIITNIIGVSLPLMIKDYIDKLLKQGLSWNSQVLIGLGVIAGIALIMAITRILSRIFIFGIGRKVESDQKQKFYTHLLGLDYLYFNTQRIGDLISRSASDIQALRQMMGFGLLNIVNIFWAYALTLPILFKLNASLTACLLVGYLPILYGAKILSNKLKTLQTEHQIELGNLSSFIEEDLNGIQVIKAYSQEEREITRFNIVNNQYFNIANNLAKIRSLVWPILGTTRTISFLIVIIYASLGLLTPGTIAALLIYLERLVFPTAILGWLITIFQKGSISVKRLNEIYSEQATIIDHSKKALKVTKGNINIQSISYAYQQERPILQDLNMKIKGGEFIGIVGSIGSGKTTLAQLLVRAIEPESGQILIDGQNIRDYSLSSLHQHIKLIPQNTFLFNATVQENLALFDKSIDINTIQKYCIITEIDQEINELSQGYQTIIGEKGVNLSGGQMQRLTIARALIQKPQILILDHSLSSIDNETALKILNNIRNEFPGITLIIITHRISSLNQASQIYLLEQRHITAQGTHQELSEASEAYRKLSVAASIK